MRRPLTVICALLCAAALPSTALAASTHGTVTGRVKYVNASSLTIQTSGKRVGLTNAMISTANAISARDYPYVWGGGHAQAGVASAGLTSSRRKRRAVGFDCSGSVTAVLVGAGLWTPGSPVPSDAGVIGQLLQQHLIARGAGSGLNEVTLYDDPGVHIFMNIDGRFFGTSDGGGGNSKGGPTWLDDGAPDATSHAYRRYHVRPSVLRNRTSYGHAFTFQTRGDELVASGAELGDTVKVSYKEAKSGAITASAIELVGT
jgi:hypothetical protein